MDRSSPTPKKDWIVTRKAFDRLLKELDPDRERAGEKYERIRLKLAKLFRWRGCSIPEEYVDRTIDRVARRLEEGAELRVSDPYLYFYGVALNVLREYWRELEKHPQPLELELRVPSSPANDEAAERADELIRKEQRLDCLGRCLRRFSRKDMNLIVNYHLGSGPNKERRARLAEGMSIPPNALRIRVYRLRVVLEDCIRRCLENPRIV